MVSLMKLRRKLEQMTTRRKIFFTVVILMLIQVAAHIPVPGVNSAYMQSLFDSGNGALGMLNAMTGGAMGRMSLTAFGVTPYITASIIMQLMAIVIPKLDEIRREGKSGEDWYNNVTYIVTLVLVLMQSILMGIAFGRQGLLIDFKWYWVTLAVIIWTISSMGLVALGKVIEHYGMGNGISLILAVNIVSGFPADAVTIATFIGNGKTLARNVVIAFMAISLILLMVAWVVIYNGAERAIVIQHSNRVNERYKRTSELPLKLNVANVVPVIFASTLFAIPPMITQFAGKGARITEFFNQSSWFRMSDPVKTVGFIGYAVLIILFSYFYVSVIFNPLEVASNLQKSGATIHGIRPGKPTAEYIQKKTDHMILLGSVFILVIVSIPCIINGIFGIGTNVSFLGTSLVIVVNVLLDTYKEIKANAKYQLKLA